MHVHRLLRIAIKNEPETFTSTIPGTPRPVVLLFCTFFTYFLTNFYNLSNMYLHISCHMFFTLPVIFCSEAWERLGGRIWRFPVHFCLLYTANAENASKSCWYTWHLVTMASEVAAIYDTWWARVSFLLLYAIVNWAREQSCCYIQRLVSAFLWKSIKSVFLQLILCFFMFAWPSKIIDFIAMDKRNNDFGPSGNIPKS